MTKIIFLLLVSITFAGSAFAQMKPYTYQLENEKKLNKQSADENPASNSVSDIITEGDTIWLGTGRGLSMSPDRGDTWINFYGSEAFGTENVSAIGYNNGTLWAATAHTIDKDGNSLSVGSGLHYTTDGGNTWNNIDQPVDADDDSIVVYGNNKLRALPVTVDVQNIIYDIAFTKGTIWIATFAGGLRKSTNDGQTWQRVVLPPDYLNSVKPSDTLNFCMQPVAGKFCTEDNLNYRVFSVVAINDSTLFVGTANGINKSTDNGISWQKFTHTNQDKPISGNFVVALAFNNYDNTLWAATWRAEGTSEFYAVSASSNGGKSWQTFLDGEKIHNFGFKYESVIAASDNGAFRSTTGGTSWILPTAIMDQRTNITLVTNTFYSAASQGNDIWLGSNDGLAKLEELAGSIYTGKWQIYFASSLLSSSNETYAFPNPFSPKLEQLKIKYTTGGKNTPVTIKIFDFNMNYVATVIQNTERGNPIHVVDKYNSSSSGVIDFWDGRDAGGNIVPNGVYFYRVEVGSDKPVFGKIIVLQ